MNKFKQKLDQARLNYAGKLSQQLEDLFLLIQSNSTTIGADKLEKAQKLAHKIHGSAGTFGFSEVSAVVGEIDQQLVLLMSGTIAGTRDFWRRIEQSLNQIRKVEC